MISVEAVIKDCELRRPTRFLLNQIKTDSKVGSQFNLTEQARTKKSNF